MSSLRSSPQPVRTYRLLSQNQRSGCYSAKKKALWSRKGHTILLRDSVSHLQRSSTEPASLGHAAVCLVWALSKKKAGPGIQGMGTVWGLAGPSIKISVCGMVVFAWGLFGLLFGPRFSPLAHMLRGPRRNTRSLNKANPRMECGENAQHDVLNLRVVIKRHWKLYV